MTIQVSTLGSKYHDQEFVFIFLGLLIFRLVHHGTVFVQRGFFRHRAFEVIGLSPETLNEDHFAALSEVLNTLTEGVEPGHHVGRQH